MKDAEDEAFDELAKRQGAWGGGFNAKRKAAADKLQEPVACVMGTYGGMFVVAPLNPAAILPVGVALYTSPTKSEWAGLTLDEIEELFQSAAGADEETDIRFARLIEAKLKDKNT